MKALTILNRGQIFNICPLSRASLTHARTHVHLFNIHILLNIMNCSPIILSNYLDNNLFQSAGLAKLNGGNLSKLISEYN